MPSETVYRPVESVKPIYAGGTLQPPKFMPSLYEWLSFKGEFICLNRNTDGDIYEVPEGYRFYLISAWVTGRDDGAVTTDGSVTIYAVYSDYQEEMYIARCQPCKINGQSVGNDNMFASFPIPIPFNQGVIIRFAESGFTTPKVRGQIMGFLVKISDIPSL